MSNKDLGRIWVSGAQLWAFGVRDAHSVAVGSRQWVGTWNSVACHQADRGLGVSGEGQGAE